ncbi:hypothetical protein [Streptomyces sp. CCM_MD2014]|uniref:hypothetical protein n=1 Tax=Streptomyces sp. CCM_MD2014 TaxID=1561022 RepID=UPI00052ACD1D|nr:hypothetical protein [Streptomyces sp. CCM_MD2014]AIV35592.1 hypothetical protein NI25_20540 [Streptomyces sp. CCM_MD2014]
MGACLEPTPAMRRYRVESSGQSFYLTRTAASPATHESRFHAVLPAPDLDAILAALDQVTSHPDWARWEEAGRLAEPDTSWTIKPGEDGPAAPSAWAVERDREALYLSGPWITGHEYDRWSAEIPYSELEDLRKALTALLAED